MSATESRRGGIARPFHELEKERQIAFKETSPHFSKEARRPGPYGSYPEPQRYCIPEAHQDENLFQGIRDEAVSYFDARKICWHGKGRNHLLSSQSFCVNFLFPFTKRPEALTELLRPIFRGIRAVLPMEGNELVAFEWPGDEDYLKEWGWKKAKRGEMVTTADAAVRIERADGGVQIVLIEWKYTERYREVSKADGESGGRRKACYRPLYEKADCPINKALLPSSTDAALEALLYEPFYQLFREQLLAREMEAHRDKGADKVSVLHVAPAQHAAFSETVTSPFLRRHFPGEPVTAIWTKLVRTPGRFLSTTTEDLFRQFPIDRFPDLWEWWKYMSQRYHWLIPHA